ncbi:MAG: ferric reductase-like transmembrane domain-containing protein [Chloroflexota bacterium]|jgi:DMSO/TMAO reductase YedYZ heme-binding membrane subunit
MRHGRYPRLRWVRWGLFAVLIALIIGATGGQALDRAAGWLHDEYQRLPWYVTRITALLSYLALSASTIYGLLLSTRLLDRLTHRPISFTLHQDLAGIGLALALVHAAVLMIDRAVPYTPLEVIVPFAGPYRPLWVGVGQLALASCLLVTISFYVRRRIGTRAWRRIHYLSFVAFAGATAHGLMAGSDTGAAWVYAGYLTAAVVVAFLTTYRIAMAVGARGGDGRPRPQAPRPRIAADAGASPPGEPSVG